MFTVRLVIVYNVISYRITGITRLKLILIL